MFGRKRNDTPKSERDAERKARKSSSQSSTDRPDVDTGLEPTESLNIDEMPTIAMPIEQGAERLTKKEQKQATKELAKKRKQMRKEGKKGIRETVDDNGEVLSDKSRKQAKARSSAKDAYSAMGFNLMYQDGTCEVEEGIFSQAIEFGDISYQSVSVADQKEYVKMYSQLFEYCGPDTTLQMNILNIPIPRDAVGNQEFFDTGEPALMPLVGEYNDVLNRKMLEGVSNMTRRRVLTFSIAADNYEMALPRLARIRTDLLASLRRIGCPGKRLDGRERLEVIYTQTCPGRRFTFEYEDLLVSGLTTKDYVCPTGIDFKPDGDDATFRQSGKYCQVLVFRKFGSQLSDVALSNIIDLAIPINVTLHVQGLDKGKSADYVKQRLGFIDKDIIEYQQHAVRKGFDPNLLPQNLSFSKNEGEELLGEIQYKNQRLFIFTGLVMTYADTPEELSDRVQRIISQARHSSIEIDELACQQLEGWNSCLPLGNNHVSIGRYLTTAQVSIMVPFATQELNEPGGGYYGQNKVSKNLILFNRKGLAAPMGFVLGMPGSGKSFAVKREIFNSYLANPEDEFIIIDPQGEYPPIVENLGGSVFRLSPSSNDHINVLDIYEGAWKVTGEDPTLMKSESMCALTGEVMGLSSALTPEETTIVDRCVREVYKRNEYSVEPPTLRDFYAVLKEQPDPEAVRLVRGYELYVEGGLNYFDHQTTVDINKRITVFSFKNLGNQMRVFAMLVILDFVYNRMLYNFERGVTTWLYIDEVQSLFANGAVLNYFDKFWAEGRKFNLIPTGITQTVERIIEHPTAKFLLANSDFLMLLRQSDRDRHNLASILGLSPQQEEYVGRAIDVGEGLLIAGSSVVPFEDNFPKGRLYDLWNTKPDEIAEQKQAAWQRMKTEEHKAQADAIRKRREEVNAANAAVERARAERTQAETEAGTPAVPTPRLQPQPTPAAETPPAAQNDEARGNPFVKADITPAIPPTVGSVRCAICNKWVPEEETEKLANGMPLCTMCSPVFAGLMDDEGE